MGTSLCPSCEVCNGGQCVFGFKIGKTCVDLLVNRKRGRPPLNQVQAGLRKKYVRNPNLKELTDRDRITILTAAIRGWNDKVRLNLSKQLGLSLSQVDGTKAQMSPTLGGPKWVRKYIPDYRG